LKLDGVFFCSSPRGWFTFGHATFSLIFFFKHVWHGAVTLFGYISAGIVLDLDGEVEFGTFQKWENSTLAISCLNKGLCFTSMLALIIGQGH
jgi:photosystem II CP47 chlorophyll apoprotein